MSVTFEKPDDILLWPDGLWCFREEYNRAFTRKNSYRVILQHNEEWLSYTPFSATSGH